MLVDETLLPLWEQVRPHVSVPTTIVVGATKPVPDGLLEYEALLADSEPATDLPDPDERDAAAMCYTTGTTGKPKGVLYSHRAIVLHTFGLVDRRRAWASRSRRRAAGRADVPRQRVGHAVRGAS